MDQDSHHKGTPPIATPPQETVLSADRGIISGDNIHFRRVKRHSRLSQSESSGAEEERLGSSVEAGSSYGRSPRLLDEASPFTPRSFEQAGGGFPLLVGSAGSGRLSASPRSPNTRPPLSFHSKHGHGLRDEAGSITTVRASGTPHRHFSGSRSRTSSESEQASKGPFPKKRGFAEMKNKPSMSGLQCLASENVWFDKHRYDEAEKRFYEGANGPATPQQHHYQQQNAQSSCSAAGDQEMVARMKSLEQENRTLHKVVEEMKAALRKLETRVCELEKSPAAVPCAKAAPVQAAPVKQVKVESDQDDDDDIDLFGSDEEDEEAERIKQERLEAYAAKKAKKPALIAKSSILLDVKPWDDETDMAKLEECVRTVQMDGLLWGASKLVPVGYGIKKLQINCVVEDDKVGTDILEEEITKFEDYVQSVDVAAFNKI